MTAQTMAPSMRGQTQRRASDWPARSLASAFCCSSPAVPHRGCIAAVRVWIRLDRLQPLFPGAADRRLPAMGPPRPYWHASTPDPEPMVRAGGDPRIIVWLVAERLGIMEGRQLMVMALVEVFFLSVLGWRLALPIGRPAAVSLLPGPVRRLSHPSPARFHHQLHRARAQSAEHSELRGWLRDRDPGRLVPGRRGVRRAALPDRLGRIRLPLRPSDVPARRYGAAVFILVSIIVPIIANQVPRARRIVVLGHILGNAEAATADHLIYGWLFFSVVILLQIAVGLPFRQDHTATTGSSAGTATQGAATRVTATRIHGDRGNREPTRETSACARRPNLDRPACDNRGVQSLQPALTHQAHTARLARSWEALLDADRDRAVGSGDAARVSPRPPPSPPWSYSRATGPSRRHGAEPRGPARTCPPR